MKSLLVLFTLLTIISATAQAANMADSAFLERIHDAKMLVADLDPRSVEDIFKELNTTSSPEGNLQIYEAVAATFRDLVLGGDAADEAGRKTLYDQIRMNVAFIQLGGNSNGGSGKRVDRWIRQTLMQYLSQDLIANDDIFHSADEWR